VVVSSSSDSGLERGSWSQEVGRPEQVQPTPNNETGLYPPARSSLSAYLHVSECLPKRSNFWFFWIVRKYLPGQRRYVCVHATWGLPRREGGSRGIPGDRLVGPKYCTAGYASQASRHILGTFSPLLLRIIWGLSSSHTETYPYVDFGSLGLL
jgi:hypothetical protein